MTAEGTRLDVLERMTDSFNAHDLEAIMSLFADDCVFESPRGPDPWGRRFAGRDAVREGLGARFTTIPDVHYGDSSHFVAGERGVSEWTLTGTTFGSTGTTSRKASVGAPRNWPQPNWAPV